MTHNKRTIPGLFLATLLTSTFAQAETGPFVGASFGSSHLDESFDGVNIDSDASAYRIVGGFQFSDYLGIEAGYHSFGDFTETIDVGGLSSLAEIAADGWTLGGTLGLPLNERFSLFGRAGARRHKRRRRR